MSGAVVAIGYIFLVPSILGILFSFFMLISAGLTGSSTSDGHAAATVVGTVAIFFGVLSFVGGLLGWLLVMKKQVLQCTHCGAVIAAS